MKDVRALSLLRMALAVAALLSAAAPIVVLHHSELSWARGGPPGTAAGDSTGVTLPPGIGDAGRTLLRAALARRPVPDIALDPNVEAARCRKYFSYHDGQYTYYNYTGRRRRRRLFLGSLIADDSWHALGAMALEVHGVYEAVAFVESNRTQTGAPRALRFAAGTRERRLLAEGGLFGAATPVTVAQFVHEAPVEGKGLIREHMQRHAILGMWRRAGMGPDDVGVLTDADETPTRDFLRAVQACDFPQLEPATQDCHAAKVVAASLVFEGSPECLTSTRKWMHPDLILGKCVEGIGDDQFKLDDTQRQWPHAWRNKKYTLKEGQYAGWPKDKTSKSFPMDRAPWARRFLTDAPVRQRIPCGTPPTSAETRAGTSSCSSTPTISPTRWGTRGTTSTTTSRTRPACGGSTGRTATPSRTRTTSRWRRSCPTWTSWWTASSKNPQKATGTARRRWRSSRGERHWPTGWRGTPRRATRSCGRCCGSTGGATKRRGTTTRDRKTGFRGSPHDRRQQCGAGCPLRYGMSTKV